MVKNLPVNAGDTGDVGSIPRSGRSPEERHGNPLQYFCLENPMDRGAWRDTVYGVSKSQTWLSDWAHRHKYFSILGALETHLSGGKPTSSHLVKHTSVQFSSVAQLCSILCDPMNRSPPGLPVHHQLPEFTQTHAHRVGDAIQPSHPLSSPSPSAPNPSQHQGLFQWVNSSHEVAKVLEFQLKHQSFQWTPRTYLLQDGLRWVQIL